MIFALHIIYRIANGRSRQAQHVKGQSAKVMVASLLIPSFVLFLPIIFSRLGL